MSWGACSTRTETPTQWKGTMGFKKPTRWHLSTLPSSRTHTTHSAYVNKVGRVQEPFASHISCMTAFHQRGRLDQEVRSYLCEVLTAKCCRNGTEYFLALLWHHDTKQLLWVSGCLLLHVEIFHHMCRQTWRTCLWLWRDNGCVKTMSLLYSFLNRQRNERHRNMRTKWWSSLKCAYGLQSI